MSQLSIDIDMNKVDEIADQIKDFKYDIAFTFNNFNKTVDDTVESGIVAGKEFIELAARNISYSTNENSAPNVLRKQLQNYSAWLHYVAKVYRAAQSRTYDYAFSITIYDFQQDAKMLEEIDDLRTIKNEYDLKS